MRKLFFSVSLSVLMILIVIGVCGFSASRIPVLHTGDRIGETVLLQNARLLFEGTDKGGLTISVVPAAELKEADLHLLIADIRSFTLAINGEMVYQFEGTPAIRRLHDIPLGRIIQPEVPLDIVIEGGSAGSMTRSVRGLIGEGSMIRSHVSSAYALTLILTGMYAAIVVNSMSLYLRKRTESYLLYMTLFTVTVACTGLLYSNLPIPDFPLRNTLHLGYLHALSEILLFLLLVKLLGIRFFNRLGGNYPVILLGTALLAVFILNRIWPPLRVVFLELIFVSTLVMTVYAFCRNRPYSDLLLTGGALAGGLSIYNTCANYGLAQPTLLMVFFHMPALYSMILDFFCMITVNAIYSQKFKEAEALIAEVEEANQQLDEKVKRRTSELEKANDRLVRQQQEKHMMMTNLFHDLRSPLFCAIGYTDMIEAKCGGNMEEITVLRRQLNYLSHLTEELFLIAKLEDKQITFTFQPVELSRLCSVLLEELKPEAESRQLMFHGEKALVTGDGFRLRQAIENLVVNAIVHTPDGTKIEVNVSCDGRRAFVKVEDDGPGIPQETLLHLFDRYYSQNPGKNGTGLGLSIAKEIVSAHGGRIDVESAPGEGSRFTVCLPALMEEH